MPWQVDDTAVIVVSVAELQGLADIVSVSLDKDHMVQGESNTLHVQIKNVGQGKDRFAVAVYSSDIVVPNNLKELSSQLAPQQQGAVMFPFTAPADYAGTQIGFQIEVMHWI